MAQEVSIELRDFDIEKDMVSVQRIWREIGWSDSERTDQGMSAFFETGTTSVGLVNDEVECSVQAQTGSMRLDHEDLPLCVIAAVTTSRVARGLSLAQQLTARELAKGQRRGEAVAVLGMFDQGFYNKLGFGTGAYINEFRVDPNLFDINLKPRTPRRLSAHDSDAMLAALMARPPLHGNVVINQSSCFQAELRMEDGVGLGYFEGKRLTHFVWMKPQGEHGPYKVKWMGYENGQGLLEILALLKSLGDQVYSIHMMEPPHVQLQSMLKRPFRSQAVAEEGKYAAEQSACAWYQLRILDIPACINALSYSGRDIVFQLNVEDPVDEMLAGDDSWRPVGGSFDVTLGQHAAVKPAQDKSLPALTCTINTLSRLIWGVSSASNLAISDGLQAPVSLLTALDGVFTPNPKPGWDF
jgi:predicted acetyltransferase